MKKLPGHAPSDCPRRPGGVWIWIVHSNPPLRVAGRKTPAEALQKWLLKFQEHILPASQAVLRDLHEQWCAHPIPPPPPGASAGNRARSTPIKEARGLEEIGNHIKVGEGQAISPTALQSEAKLTRRVCKKGPSPQL